MQLDDYEKMLITELLRTDANTRLGGGRGGAYDVLRHRYFADVDWDAMRAMTLASPLQSLVQVCDTAALKDVEEGTVGWTGQGLDDFGSTFRAF
eukprot:m.1376234 g.1376234  ORF g.1376234 m.1376234 type:complete len:94 (-) comp24963_c0_seq8:284-565(-)